MPGRGVPSGREVQMRLYRDSLTTPWGFRLQGGRDLNSPLVVQKVLPCTPADGELQRGDVLLEINSNDATKMTHVQAQDIIRKAGGSLLVRLVRTGHVEFIPAPSVPALSQPSRPPPARRNIQAPVNRDLGTDYNRVKYNPVGAAPMSPTREQNYNPQSNFMLNRVQDSLSHSLWSSGSPSNVSSPGYYDSYSVPWVLSSSSAAPSHHPSWDAPSNNSAPVASISRHAPAAAAPTPRHRAVNDGGEAPAWLGSLRSSGQPLAVDSHAGTMIAGGGGGAGAAPAPQPHAPRIQGVHYSADGTPRYRQSASEGVDSETARAVHLQYNSPLGLYSKASAQEAMSGQLNGRAGQGTIGITSDTEVQRMIREEERSSSNGRGAGRGLNPPTGDSQIRQSPSVRALESKFADVGISDF